MSKIVSPFKASQQAEIQRLVDSGADASKYLGPGAGFTLSGANHDKVVVAAGWTVNADGYLVSDDNNYPGIQEPSREHDATPTKYGAVNEAEKH